MKNLFVMASMLFASASAQAFVIECSNQEKNFQVSISAQDAVKAVVTDNKSATPSSVVYKCDAGALGDDDKIVSSFICSPEAKDQWEPEVKIYFFTWEQKAQYENLKTEDVEFGLKCELKAK